MCFLRQQLHSLKESTEPLVSLQQLPALLRDTQTLQQGAQLLSCTSVALEYDNEHLWLKTRSNNDGEGAGLHVLVLYVAVRGLMLLLAE